ncbi:MAG: hypothetical protein A4E65_01250 [Syntrophorhabdus sp. PtaU1.Bin153]|nr:MAG: hypothetical protein A4E65_01250 [Syntrophorhabdus sp. PtaU1.Bin153]
MSVKLPNRLLPMRWDHVSVECYSGYKANERPVAFTFHGRRWKVAEIIDRWYEGGVEPGRPEANYFKVRTYEGKLFLLRYLSLFDSWSIQAYKDPTSVIGVC